MTSRPPNGDGRARLPAELARRFEGVLLWSGSATLARRTARSLVALADAGMAVAYVAPGSVDDLAERLGAVAGRAPSPCSWRTAGDRARPSVAGPG